MFRLLVAALLLTGPSWADEVAGTQLTGQARKYKPLISFRPGAMKLQAPLLANLTYEKVSAFDVDPQGTEFAPDPTLDTQLRAGLVFDTANSMSPIFLRLEASYLYEAPLSGGISDDFEAVDPPTRGEAEGVLERAYGRLTVGPFLTLAGGYMLSHWGLGLLANDGLHGWSPKSAAFSNPGGGDRVLRTFAATGPWTGADLFVVFGYDWVQGDDALLEGDEAQQFVASAVLGFNKSRSLGAYVAFREQEAEDGQRTEVIAADVYGKWRNRVGKLRYTTEAEVALITGETELAPTTDFETHDVLQLGAAVRAHFDLGSYGAVLDYLFASGDQNYDDKTQNAFKPDPNYEVGLLLYRHVLSATTARAPIRASDPDLVGYASEDLERFPTRGSASNTHAIFPRAWVHPMDGLEVYGGPLFALGDVAVADPRNSRLAGGEPRNAFDESGDGYLGTELDLGVRYDALLWGTNLMFGLEGAVFFPGAALEGLDRVFGARAMLEYRL